MEKVQTFSSIYRKMHVVQILCDSWLQIKEIQVTFFIVLYFLLYGTVLLEKRKYSYRERTTRTIEVKPFPDALSASSPGYFILYLSKLTLGHYILQMEV